MSARVLSLAIRAYRRWLSGRGPLRRVRCTFDDSESCSAFGLRAACEAPTTRVALARIRRRLRRCGDASLFALDARVLGWGAGHDRPLDELHAELVADGETDATRAQVLSAREVASRWRGDIGDVLAVRARRADLPAVRPRLRRPPTLTLIARAFVWRLVAAAAFVIPATLVAPLLGLAVAALAALPLAAFVRGHVARRARLAHQVRAAAATRGSSRPETA
jgi:putative component of membrane protein insertase Oxa1/YidC/SpoIIIJ protein YidD